MDFKGIKVSGKLAKSAKRSSKILKICEHIWNLQLK